MRVIGFPNGLSERASQTPPALRYTAAGMNWPAFCLFIFAGGVSSAVAQIPNPAGVPRELARDRAARISDIRYDLSYTLAPGASTLRGEARIHFRLRGNDSVLLDFRQGHVRSVWMNGAATPAIIDGGHLELLPAGLRRGENEVHIEFDAAVANAGTAITRFNDRDDGSEYLYTLLVPMDASLAFPCFDQPDLKARFRLTLTAPAAWTVISNSPVENVTTLETPDNRTTFAETAPISTYLFAFAAGPFRKLDGRPGMPEIYARDSASDRAQAEVAHIEEITSWGIDYFSEYFAQPYPFAKYDTVLIPGLAYAGMEHAGATFLREESVLFPTVPTRSDLFRRDVLILHELAHQWFGDLVTMRWFDDLWLKEGFVQYMAFRALDSFGPADNAWKRFYESTKPAAYAIDGTLGTTPIYQDISNLQDAKSAYGPIVYSKAPSVLRQLAYVVGEQAFREGLRNFLRAHAFGNAEWNDLVRALEQASGTSLRSWADAWIHRRGMPQVDVTWSCEGTRLRRLSLSQRGVLNVGGTWPLVTQVLLDYGEAEPARLRVRMNARTIDVAEAAGRPCPRFIFANDEDFAYGRFLLDERSQDAVLQQLPDMTDPFRKALLWGALWEAVRQAQLSPHTYAELAARALPRENDEALTSSILAHVATLLHRYVSDEARERLAPEFEKIAIAATMESPEADLKIAWFRAFVNIGQTPAAAVQFKALLSGDVVIPDIDLRSLDRWNLITALLAMNDPEAMQLLEQERQQDSSGVGLKFAYAAEAARADADTKQKYFEEYLKSDARPEDWIEQSLAPFNSWNQAELTHFYLKKALDALPQIKEDRRIFFLGRWLAAFIGGQRAQTARDEIHRYLDSSRLDKDLRLKVLEAVDELDRTLAIRRRFPE